MHIRSSFSRGTVVIADCTGETVGYLGDPLINADSGKIEAFSVFTAQGCLLLQVRDIVSWSMHVHIREPDVLGPPSDFVRLQHLAQDDRTVLHQPILVDTTKKKLGICRDVQFDTRHFKIEWIFPRRFFREATPIPAVEIIEVKSDAIYVRDPCRPMKNLLHQAQEEDMGSSNRLQEVSLEPS